MITLRKSEERFQDQKSAHKTWHTFAPKARTGAQADHFGSLESLDENRLEPGGSISLRESRDTELVSYVREGTLSYEESVGGSGVVATDEFQSMTLCLGSRHKETNASKTDTAQVFRIGMHTSQADLPSELEQKRFTAAQRRGRLCVIASPDGRKESLRIHQDALIYSALLESGSHVVYELVQGRSAWLHAVCGEITVGEIVLAPGDGVGISGELSVSLTAREESEILLIDLGPTRETAEANAALPTNNHRCDLS